MNALPSLGRRFVSRRVVITTVMTLRKSAMLQIHPQRSRAFSALRTVLAGTIALATLLVAPPAVQAQALPAYSQASIGNSADDPPGQVARVNVVEGSVSVLAASSGLPGSSAQAWTAADLNRPLTRGDRVFADRGARAELHVGSTALRLDGWNVRSSLAFQRLDDTELLLALDEGSLILRVRALWGGQRLEVSTPNLTFAVTQPGDYRLDVNLATGITRVVAQTGGGIIYGDRTAPLTITAQQQGSFSGVDLTQAPPGAALQDSFDAWAAARDRQEDQSVAARYVPREVVGYQQLDTYGDWTQDVAYGAVWLPRVVPANWAPYRVGQWRWVAPWGWTWVDDAPWGFAPFHYGRWAQIGPRWGWVPGRLAPRPVYAPALVAFIGEAGGDAANWSGAPGLGGGQRPGLGWFPLAPGEAYRPAYRASASYVTQVNHNTVINNTLLNDGYRYQRQGSAVTAAAADEFARGRAVRGRASGLSAEELGRAPLMNNRFDAVPALSSFRGGVLASAPVAPHIGRPFTTVPTNGPTPQPSRPGDRDLPAQALRPTGLRAPDRLLDTEIQARREQHRLQFEQQRNQNHLARQQEAQRQRDQASPGERAMQMQQEQAQRIQSQQHDAQRLDFQRAQQQQLQSQQQRIQAAQQEVIGQRALREQAERQRQSDERVRTQQFPRPNRETRGNDAVPDGNARGHDRRGFGRPE